MNKFILLFLMFCNLSYAFTINKIDNDDHILITINGYFDENSYDHIKNNIEKNKNIIIHANSHGGYANDILDIMDLIHNNSVTWIVDNKSSCESVCALAAIASKDIHGVIKFHQVSNLYTQQRAHRLNYMVKQKLISYGIAEEKAEDLMESYNLKSITF